MAINAAWHEAHVMPKSATMDQRLAWHIEHTQQCACREIPESVRKYAAEKGIDVPGAQR